MGACNIEASVAHHNGLRAPESVLLKNVRDQLRFMIQGAAGFRPVNAGEEAVYPEMFKNPVGEYRPLGRRHKQACSRLLHVRQGFLDAGVQGGLEQATLTIVSAVCRYGLFDTVVTELGQQVSHYVTDWRAYQGRNVLCRR